MFTSQESSIRGGGGGGWGGGQNHRICMSFKYHFQDAEIFRIAFEELQFLGMRPCAILAFNKEDTVSRPF